MVGLGVGLVVGGGLGMLMFLLGLGSALGGDDGLVASLTGSAAFLLLGLLVGASLGVTVGVGCGAVAVAALVVADAVMRTSGRRLTRRAGTVVVGVSVLVAPVVAVVGWATVGEGDPRLALTLSSVGLVPLMAAAGLATQRYRRATRPRDT